MPYRDIDTRRAKQREYASRPEVKARAKERMAAYAKSAKYRAYDLARSQSPERKAWLKEYRTKPERIMATKAIEARRDQKSDRVAYKQAYAKSAAKRASHKKTMARYLKTERGKAYLVSKSIRRRARAIGAHGSHTSEQWFALVNAFGGRCAYCGKAKKLERDHATPLAKGGSNEICNILPACRSCNGRKMVMTAAEFMGAQDHG